MKHKHSRQELLKAVSNSLSIRELLTKLGMAPKGGNYETIKSRLQKEEISTSHFLGMGWKKDRKFPSERRKIQDILIEHSVYSSGLSYNSYQVKNLLFENNLKDKICEVCGIVDWQSKEIKFELHHINGNRKDNRIENLKILCPNCHSQTDNFRSKNSKY